MAAAPAATPVVVTPQVPVKPLEPVESFIDKGNTKLPIAPELEHKPEPVIVTPAAPAPKVVDLVPHNVVPPAPVQTAAPEDKYVVPKLSDTGPNLLPVSQPPAPVASKPVVEIVKPKEVLSLPDMPPILEEVHKPVAVDPIKPKPKYSFTISMPKIITDFVPKPLPIQEVKKTVPAPVVKAMESKVPPVPVAPAQVVPAPVPAVVEPKVLPVPVVPVEKVVVQPVPVAPAQVVPAPVPAVVEPKVPPVPVVPVEKVVVVPSVPAQTIKAPEPKQVPMVPVVPIEKVAPTPVQPAIKVAEPKVQPAPVASTAPIVKHEEHTVAPAQVPAPVKIIPKAQVVTPQKKIEVLPAKLDPRAVAAHPVVLPVKPVDPELEKFVQNEMGMLSVPDDDVVLGVVTTDSKFLHMGYSQYLSLYRKYRESVKRAGQFIETTAFIDGRRRIDGNDTPILANGALFRAAVNNIQYSKVDDIRVLADNYKLLDLVDDQGNSLLHVAAFQDNTAITKWLIMRGANVNAMNYDTITAKDIAEYEQYWDVFNLLDAANAR